MGHIEERGMAHSRGVGHTQGGEVYRTVIHVLVDWLAIATVSKRSMK